MKTGFILLIVGGLILTIGDVFMKEWSLSNKWTTFIMGMSIWIMGLVCLAFSFKSKNIAVASLIFSISNVIFMTLLSWFYYKEPLTTSQIIGMVLGIISIIFLER